MTDGLASVLLIVGSAVFLAGAAIGVPGVFMEPDADARQSMLEARAGRWRFAQPLYALGPLIAALGVGVLAVETPAVASRLLLTVAGVLLTVGALAWSWTVHLRTVDIVAFAWGRLPGWPFATYVLLTTAGLASLGAGLLVAGSSPWIGWLTLAADAAFVLLYLRSGDIPPFVFYLLLLLVGATL
jgi:hypothetical protein